MKKYLILMMSLGLFMFTGCSKSTPSAPGEPEVPDQPDSPDQPSVVEKLPIRISMKSLSGVTDTDYEINDEVGLYVVNYNNTTPGSLQDNGNHVDNVSFTKSSNAWTPAKEIFWKDDKTKADFYCYYPYVSVMKTISYSFAVKEDQSTDSNYKASEFLWGKVTGATPTKEPVYISTDRLMSNIIVKVKPGKGFTEESFASASISVKICNLKNAANINLKDGTVSASGEVKEITPNKTSEGYRALIVPQSVIATSELLHVFINGEKFVYQTEMDFKANTRHTLTITVDKVGGSVNIGIGGWQDDTVDHGGHVE